MAKGIGFYEKDWFSVKKDKDLLYESIIRILMTSRGERVMRPDFGVGLNKKLFEVITPDLLQDLAVTIHNTISVYENRVSIENVQTEFLEDINAIKIHIFMKNIEEPLSEAEELVIKYSL